MMHIITPDITCDKTHEFTNILQNKKEPIARLLAKYAPVKNVLTFTSDSA